MMTGVNHIDGDKDDIQSLVHALMYQDKINIVGIASSTSHHQPGKNDEKFINLTLDEYAKDYSKLAAKASGFKTAGELKKITYQGTKKLADSSGAPPATEGSNAIIKEAKAAKAAGEPLYIATWGGIGDVARALKDAPEIAGTVRLLSVYGQGQEPNAYNYIKANHAGKNGFWWIDQKSSFRGVYSAENSKTNAVTLDQVKEFADGHGALGTLFYKNSQDLRGTGDNTSGLKMGDSGTILYLIDNADNNNPTAESWGGEYRQIGTNTWTDKTGDALNYSGSNGARTIYEDRAAWLGDFKARLDWLKGGSSNPPNADVPDAPITPAPKPPSTPAPTPVTPTGDDTITVKISGTAYKGDPNFAILVDGKVIDSTNLVTADYKEGEWQTFTFKGDFDRLAGDQKHKVGIQFTNNLSGSTGDRNLYVDEITFNGETNTRDQAITWNTTKYSDFIL